MESGKCERRVVRSKVFTFGEGRVHLPMRKGVVQSTGKTNAIVSLGGNYDKDNCNGETS